MEYQLTDLNDQGNQRAPQQTIAYSQPPSPQHGEKEPCGKQQQKVQENLQEHSHVLIPKNPDPGPEDLQLVSWLLCRYPGKYCRGKYNSQIKHQQTDGNQLRSPDFLLHPHSRCNSCNQQKYNSKDQNFNFTPGRIINFPDFDHFLQFSFSRFCLADQNALCSLNNFRLINYKGLTCSASILLYI